MTARTSWLAGDRYELVVTIPGLRLQSDGNAREHHMARYRRRKAARTAVGLVVRAALHGGGVSAPLEVTVTRIGPKPLDADNAWSSAKAAIDGVADALGVDDADPRITWKVEQRRGKPREYAVEVRIVRGTVVA